MATSAGWTVNGLRWRRPMTERNDSITMRDGFGRRIEYLRISVTDKCNLRCVYCMPEEGLPWLKRAQLLSYEEITAIVQVMARMGLRRIRITGSEPLLLASRNARCVRGPACGAAFHVVRGTVPWKCVREQGLHRLFAPRGTDVEG